ncbi:MAG TPA: TQO small subunit DoxD [Candidatus Dormibacteraeota bacterium]|nr:TQO small subunit DoxD [Candidatus Dormibacteraeota bacterium]
MLPSNRHYALVLTALRIFAGLFWLDHGVGKFTHAQAFMPPNGFMPGFIAMAIAHTSGPYHDFLVNIVTPNESLFAELVRAGEVLTGCGLLLGVFTRFSGLVGVVLAMNYLTAKGGFSSLDGWTGIDGAAVAISAICLLLPLGRPLGVDALLYAVRPKRRDPAYAVGPTNSSEPVVAEFVEEPPLQEPTAPRE